MPPLPNYDPLPPPPMPMFVFPKISTPTKSEFIPPKPTVPITHESVVEETGKRETVRIEASLKEPIAGVQIQRSCSNDEEVTSAIMEDLNILASFGVLPDEGFFKDYAKDKFSNQSNLVRNERIVNVAEKLKTEYCEVLIQNNHVYGDVSKYYKDTPLIQEALDRINVPLVGVQYVLEVQGAGASIDVDSCYYVCALCEKRMSSKTIAPHIKSVPHRLKFIEFHCPTLHRVYGRIPTRDWTNSLVKEFSAEIEKAAASLGRFQVAVCIEPCMNRALELLKANVGNLDAFRRPVYPAVKRQSAAARPAGLPDFLREKLKAGLKRTPAIPPTPPSAPVGGGEGGVKRPKLMASLHAREEAPVAARVVAFKKDFDNFYSRHSEKEMYYKRKPESHPEYSTEWKMFWERRYHELVSKGMDPNLHDFKSEWSMFWSDRMKDIFSTTVENKKEVLMKKHFITKDDLEEKPAPKPWERDNVPKEVEEMKFSVVGTLTMLQGMDDILGAFSPGINALLMKAVKFSSEGRRAKDIFLQSDNRTLIKLSYDKLIGHITNESQARYSRRMKTIDACKWLLDEIKQDNLTNEEYLGVDIEKLAENTRGFDTVKIAQEIAMSLFQIGKSNVSEEQLQKILLAVSARHAQTDKENEASAAKNNTASERQVSSTTSGEDNKETVTEVDATVKASVIETVSNKIRATPSPSVNPAETEAISVASTAQAVINSVPLDSTAVGGEDVIPVTKAGSPKTSGGLGQLISAYDEDQTIDMEKLSLEDLVNLLSNFKDLSRDEQRALTTYLKKLEATDTKKVTKLREMVQKQQKQAQATKPKKPANNEEVVENKQPSEKPAVPQPEPEPEPQPANTSSMKEMLADHMSNESTTGAAAPIDSGVITDSVTPMDRYSYNDTPAPVQESFSSNVPISIYGNQSANPENMSRINNEGNLIRSRDGTPIGGGRVSIHREGRPVSDVGEPPMMDRERRPMYDRGNDTRMPVSYDSRLSRDREERPLVDSNERFFDNPYPRPISDAERRPSAERAYPMLDRDGRHMVGRDGRPILDRERHSVVDRLERPVGDRREPPMVDEFGRPLIQYDRRPEIDREVRRPIDRGGRTMVDEFGRPIVERGEPPVIDHGHRPLMDREPARTLYDREPPPRPLYDREQPRPMLERDPPRPLYDHDPRPIFDRDGRELMQREARPLDYPDRPLPPGPMYPERRPLSREPMPRGEAELYGRPTLGRDEPPLRRGPESVHPMRREDIPPLMPPRGDPGRQNWPRQPW